MNKYAYLIAGIIILLVVLFVFMTTKSKPNSFAEAFVNGYWTMRIKDEDDNDIDEHVLYVQPEKGKLKLLFAFDEDEEPEEMDYKIIKRKSKFYRNHVMDLQRIGEGEGPEYMKMELNVINGTLKLVNPEEDTSYGFFYKDNSAL